MLLACLAAGCATGGAGRIDQPPPEAIELADTPFFAQRQYHCGPAAMAMVLGSSGIHISPDELARQVYLPERRGSLQVELSAAARRQDRVPYKLDPDLAHLVSELQAGRPVLVLVNLGMDWLAVWHYAVVIGFSPGQDQIILRSGRNRRHPVKIATFDRMWARADRWALTLLPPGELPARPDRDTYLRALAAMEGVASPTAMVAAYQSAAQRWPDSLGAAFGLANARQSAGDTMGAEAGYREILERRPDHAPTLNNLALLLHGQGCRGQALATIEAALATSAGRESLGVALRATRADILTAPHGVGTAVCAGSFQPSIGLRSGQTDTGLY